MWCYHSIIGPILFDVTPRGVSRVVIGTTDGLDQAEASLDVSSSGDPTANAVVSALALFLDTGDDSLLAGLSVDLSKSTGFRTRVYDVLRGVRAGQTVTYGQLAELVGVPGGARAVANAMAANPVPLLVPCHRVVAAHGLGGFSAGKGLETKRWLLALERATL